MNIAAAATWSHRRDNAACTPAVTNSGTGLFKHGQDSYRNFAMYYLPAAPIRAARMGFSTGTCTSSRRAA